ncbi:polysaccharide biosynthesis/export family protein [Bacteroides difficilis]|uniref:Polysaccharide biosynthesis/export family protein n=1 Tax=Bacteroides difficilis TaxID=2763021 RepID=A0ABR7CEZ4_9BACE|nr:polysaccharide biosynthesis/export family protein [Bacteroides difficilis]MBC5606382.1 polysaccharide biosynthesis/export family protein [Bacteroides difficilis]
MKKFLANSLLLLCLAGGLTSCVSSKKMLYLQGANSLDPSSQKVLDDYELHIKPDDQLYITINSKAPELLTPFANSQVLGSSTTSGALQELQGLLVDKNGDIEVPVLGKIHVVGLTRLELAGVIKNKLIEGEYIKDPTVEVRFKGVKILLLGEVNSPGVKELPSDRVTILDAIGLGGDLPPTAKRNNIQVIREENGERKSYTVDLTSSEDIFNSPVYYMQQNDVVYVEPNKSINVKGSSALTYLSAGGSIIGVLASVLSLIFILAK